LSLYEVKHTSFYSFNEHRAEGSPTKVTPMTLIFYKKMKKKKIKMKTRLFDDDEWNIRMNNHELMFLEQGRTLVKLEQMLFRLENRFKNLENRNKVYEDALRLLANKIKMVIK